MQRCSAALAARCTPTPCNSVPPDPCPRNPYPPCQDQVSKVARRLLPPGGHRAVNSLNNTHIAVTYPARRGEAPAVQQLVSQFDSDSDLIQALEASTYIPYYAGPRLTMS